MTATLVEGYKAGKSPEALATEVGRTLRSVVAKLSKEQVYKAPAKEAGKREMKKAEMVAAIAAKVGVNEEVLESLEKATSPALMAVLKALPEVA
jgi:molybdopterin converting factor small subunit